MVKFVYMRFILLLTFISLGLTSQNLVYKFKSRVEVRNWKLSSKAYKQETFLQGASVELYEGTKLLSKTTSDKDGNFELDLPSTGNYTIMVNSPGYNSRKFSVTCNSIIIKDGAADFIPSVEIRGFVAFKAIKNVGDMGLSYASVQMADEKNNILKYNGLKFAANMIDGELREIQKFCTTNKLGDMALQNKNYALAKRYYLMAINMMEHEEYPKEQLIRAEEGLKELMFAEKANRSKGRAVASKKQVKVQGPVNPQYQSSQKSSSGGHKVLPVLGGKK